MKTLLDIINDVQSTLPEQIDLNENGKFEARAEFGSAGYYLNEEWNLALIIKYGNNVDVVYISEDGVERGPTEVCTIYLSENKWFIDAFDEASDDWVREEYSKNKLVAKFSTMFGWIEEFEVD